MNQTQINETKSKKWCKWLPLLAAFLIPLLISVIICIDHEVYPFGERCLLQVDMYHQYCPFFTEFVDKLRSGESSCTRGRSGLVRILCHCLPIIWQAL